MPCRRNMFFLNKYIKLRSSRDYLFPSVPLVRFRHPVTPLRYADKRIVNITKVFIERNNLQLELIRYRKKCCGLYTHVYFCEATSSMHRLGTKIFTLNASLFARWQQVRMPRISERFDHCHFWTVIENSNYLLFTQFLTVKVADSQGRWQSMHS